MAAAIAYEPPSISKAWAAFLAHIPTILLIWVVTIVIAVIGVVASLALTALGVGLSSGGGGGAEAAAGLAAVLGNLVQLPFTILSNLVGVLFVAVPAMHYASGEIIDTEGALRVLLHRPVRYLLAGVLFTAVAVVGFVLCILPGLAVTLVMPIYVNKIFLTDSPILDAFSSSFQAVYGSPQGRVFAGIELLAWLLVLVVSLFTCGLASLVAVPVATFYIQNAAYHRGVIS
ncbi:hypothetical protein VB738_00385 [Cyanobium gracile UHCC 0139]|uniref:Integral membrane protein n=1 Tax=Cyanobium gracile UHCC 0139 TaxID=3110308 RepID=A0ABU5RNN7_9CYAN|nr:hypothetical protein [Cyanobium gracile]MEA5389703.1 hypothetical protein [Cyanobium gracile UHCC 0139]